MDLKSLIAVGFAIYAVCMLSIALYFMTRVRNATDYVLAGRGLPFWALLGTFTATGVGTGVIFGASGLAYRHGWIGCAYPLGLGVGIIVVGLFFSKMRACRFMTLSEEIASYYEGNRIIFEFSNVLLFLAQFCWLTVQILGGGMVLAEVTGLPNAACMIFVGLIAAMASIPGGLVTVVYTDVLQAVILIAGFAALTATALHDMGGLVGLGRKVPDEFFCLSCWTLRDWWEAGSIFLALLIGVIACPGRRMVMYSGRSEAASRWGMIGAGMIEIAFAVVVGIVGMYAYALNSHIANQDKALTWLITAVLPKGLAAVVVVSTGAAIFSAANGSAAAISSYFVRHIHPLLTGTYPRRPVLTGRLSLACAFVICTGMAIRAGDIVSFVGKFLAVTSGGLAVIVLMGRFWRRATWGGALATLIASAVVSSALIVLAVAVPSTAAWWFVEQPIIPAAVIGLIAGVAASLMTFPGKVSFESVVAAMQRQRQSIDQPQSAECGLLAAPAAPQVDEAPV